MRPVHFELLEQKKIAPLWWGLLAAWLLVLLLLNLWMLRPKVVLNHEAAATLPAQSFATPAPVEQTPLYFESASKAWRQHRSRWRPVLASIEAHPLAGIRLSSVVLSGDDEVVQVTLQAQDLALVLAHLNELNSSASPARWALQSVEIPAAEQGAGRKEYRVSLRGSVK